MQYRLLAVVGDQRHVRTVRQAAALGRPSAVIPVASWRFAFWELSTKREALRAGKRMVKDGRPLSVSVSRSDDHRDLFSWLRPDCRLPKGGR